MAKARLLEAGFYTLQCGFRIIAFCSVLLAILNVNGNGRLDG
jgi:hypothetical protein